MDEVNEQHPREVVKDALDLIERTMPEVYVNSIDEGEQLAAAITELGQSLQHRYSALRLIRSATPID